MKHKNFTTIFVQAAQMLLAVMLTLGTQTAWAQSTFSGGNGKQGNPYKIANATDLNQLAADVNSGTTYANTYFKMTADIAYSTENNYTAIGSKLSNNDEDDHPFCGTFDGDGHTVSGIRIYKGGSENTDNNQGLFGYVRGGTVKNVTISDSRITGNLNVGGIIGRMQSGTIENCLVIGTIVNCNATGGAIVGYGNSTNCTLKYNYYNYSDCTMNGSSNNIGIGYDTYDVTDNDGAVSATILSETAAVSSSLNGRVAFRRTFTGDKASTVCLPFGIDATQAAAEGKFFTFVGVDKTADPWEVIMKEADPTADPPVAGNEASTLSANTPYLFKPAATGPVLFHGTAAATISAGKTPTTGNTDGWVFKGTYARINWSDDPQTIYGFAAPGKADLAEGKFFRVNGGSNSYVLPFRAYLQYSGTSSARAVTRGGTEDLPETMTVRFIDAVGTPTAIGTLNTRTGEVVFGDAWYSLDGRRIQGQPTKKGIYINKGYKIIIK